MKYDVFMWTRTFDADYGWVVKPDYMPDKVQKTCQSIINLARNDSFAAISESDWCSGFYYLRVDGCCLLARVAKTVYLDRNDEPIISFEGVCVRALDERLLFYNIPNLINKFFPPARSFRTKYDETGSLEGTIQLTDEEMVLKPFATELPSVIHPALKNNTAFAHLLKFIAFTNNRTGFMFGKGMNNFANYVSKANLKLEFVFDYDKPESPGVDENSFTDNYKPLTIDYNAPIATGQDKVAVNLFIQETGENTHRYKWVIMPWDSSVKDGNRVRYSTKFYDVTNQIELSRLELQKEAIRKFLLNSGWTKQRYGLRFEKDIFQREVK
ncbi:MAG: hypothetical protein FWG45_02770 [Oscillospiraceae bacterium]|nr:hypothetical protein [Oscillospiraceae bacterium]